MSEDRKLDASVVIASYNSGDVLLWCLEKLSDQSHPPEKFEVVVVLDGSTDGSKTALDKLSTPFPLTVVEQENRGKPAAINRGILSAAGKYLVFIDADILVNRDFVANHLAWHDRGDVVTGPIPLAEAESPTSFLTDGVKQWADEHFAEMSNLAGPISATQMYGGNFSVLLEDYKRVGGYREELTRSDDYNLGKKFIDAGLEIVFCPDAIGAQVYDKTIPAWCHDFYVDGRCNTLMVQQFPEIKHEVRIGHYYPVSATKCILRRLIIYRTPLGDLIVGLAQFLLERMRKMGSRSKFLAACNGVIGDALYFRGVYEVLGDRQEFLDFVAEDPEPADSE